MSTQIENPGEAAESAIPDHRFIGVCFIALEHSGRDGFAAVIGIALLKLRGSDVALMFDGACGAGARFESYNQGVFQHMLRVRRVFVSFTAIALCQVLIGAGVVAAQDRPKVLMFTKSSGYQHSVVKRGPSGELGLAEHTVVELGKKHGFDVEVTKDGAAMKPENLKKFTGIFFYTQGDLTQSGTDKQPPMAPEDRTAILDYVKAGGGFVGTHCGGADTFNHNIWVVDGKKPFIEMVGGEFIRHGSQQEGNAELVDATFPAVSHMPKAFRLKDEWYAYENFQPNIRVLMQLRTDQDGFDKNGKGLYQRPPYPITWCQMYGKGRVFYTGMGHREDVWENSQYQEMVGKAVLWSVGKLEGTAEPNLKEMYGSVDKALERINPPKTP